MKKEIIKTEHGVKARLIKENTPATSASAQPGNGIDQDAFATNEGLQILSGLISRMQLTQTAGLQFGGLRDLYSVFGYKKQPTTDDYLVKYMRQDIATRIIDAPPAAVWANPPKIEQETQQTEWDALDRKVKLWNAMYRADRLARLNPFSVLLFGFDDGRKLDRPVNPDKVKNLLYMRAIGARLIHEMTVVTDNRDPRFGFPETYTIKFDDPKAKDSKVNTIGGTTIGNTKDLKVHHSRIVHVVENALEDQVHGIPIIEKVYNLLDDLLKTSGGTAETFWLTGNRGLQADVDKEMEINPEDAAALSDEIDEYMHQLRRFIRTRGVKLNVLESDNPRPKEIFEMIIALISGTTGIPKRILVGAEAGQLASEQDRANWAERIEERRALFCEPVMLEPTVDLLQSVQLLSDGEITFEWPSAFIQNPLEEGQTMAQTARAIGNISRQTGNKAPMQLTSREEARKIIGLEGDLAESDIIEPPEEPPPRAPFEGAPGEEASPGEEE